MSYRELQLRQQTKNQLTKLQQAWHQLENQYKGDILALQNSTDIKLLNQAQQKIKEMKTSSKRQQNQITKLEQKDKNLLNKLDNYLAKL
jgi:hypothetical protein